MKASKHWKRQLLMARGFLAGKPSSQEMVVFSQLVMAFDHPSIDMNRVMQKMDLFLKEFNLDFKDIPLDGLPAADKLIFRIRPHDAPESMMKNITTMYFWNAATYLRIKQYLKPKSILEIGGGYGALAKFFVKLDDCKYSIFDFPEVSALAKGYLREAGVRGVKMLSHEDDLADHYDLIISKGSIQEMTAKDRDLWMEYIRTHCDYYYSLNYAGRSKDYKETEDIDPLVIKESEWETLYSKRNPPIVSIDSIERDWLEVILKRREL